MIRSFDEYKRIYDEITLKEGIEEIFELWVTFSWLEDRFPSFKKPAKNPQESQYRQKYFKQSIKRRLLEVCKNDTELAKVLIVGFHIMDTFSKEYLEELAELYHR